MTPKIPTEDDVKKAMEPGTLKQDEIRDADARIDRAIKGQTPTTLGTCQACQERAAVMIEDNGLSLCYFCLQGCYYEGEEDDKRQVHKPLADLAAQMVDVTEAYTVGYDAFFKGATNPFSLARGDSTKWSAGWHQAEADRAEEIKSDAQRVVEAAAAEARRGAMVSDASLKMSDRMALPIEMSGYELAEVFKEWVERAIEEAESDGRIDRGIYNIEEPGKIGPPRMVDFLCASI